MTNKEFIQHFEADTLAGEFHHAEHVRLAFAYLSENAPLRALETFSAALRRYAEARGKSGLYHDSTSSMVTFDLSPIISV